MLSKQIKAVSASAVKVIDTPETQTSVKYLLALRLFCGLIGTTLCAGAPAEIRDNNHIFEVAELGIIKVELLAQTSGIALGKLAVPEFENKQPDDLYQRTLETHELLRELQAKSYVGALPEIKPLAEQVRNEDTYDLLELINEGLDVLLEQQNLERPLGPESLYGKSANDNYSRLWYLNRLLVELNSPPDSRSVQTQLAFIKKSLRSIAEHKSLASADSTSQRYQQKSFRDIMLVAYQNSHLLGRLQRQLQVAPIKPATLETYAQALIDIFELTRSTIGHLYRTRITLRLPDPGSVDAATEDSTVDDIYLNMREIHAELMAMTGSQAL